MDILNRLNPFHRPTSSLSRHTPIPFVKDRSSKSMEVNSPRDTPVNSPLGSTHPSVYPLLELGQEFCASYPAKVETEHLRKVEHQRSHSLLKNLAHHSSLSALRSKSTRGRKKGDKRKGIPPMPDLHPEDLFPKTDERPLTASSGKLRKGSLKGSKSLPRGLRFSGEFEGLPPLPVLLTPHSMNKWQPKPTSKNFDRHTLFKRSKKNGHATSNDFTNASESLKIHTMFDINTDINQTDVPRRIRVNSFDERASLSGELTPKAQIHRHFSSPPKVPDPMTEPFFVYSRTQQYSHSVLPSSNQQTFNRSEHASSTIFSPGDIVPLTDSGRTIMETETVSVSVRRAEGDIGLMSRSEMIPVRGDNDDCEGVENGFTLKSSLNALGLPSVCDDHSSPTHKSPQRRPLAHRRAESSPSPGRVSRDTFANAAKRSSSPFEIKLTPRVTRRMSLDAFGTTSPADFNSQGANSNTDDFADFDEAFESDSSASLEEQHVDWAEQDEKRQGSTEQSQLETESVYEHPLASFNPTELSTIRESWSSISISNHSCSLAVSEFDPASPEAEDFPTIRPSWDPFHARAEPCPRTPMLSSNGLPLPAPSPFSSASPLLHKKAVSAPPMIGVSPQLLDAHLKHSQSLKDQIQASSVMMEVLKSEVNELKGRLKREIEEKEDLLAFAEGRVMDLEDAQRQCDAKDQALEQLRQVMSLNEHGLEELREDKSFYRERCEDLEQENDALTDAKEKEMEKLMAAEIRLEEQECELRTFKGKNAVLQNIKNEAERTIFSLGEELRFVEKKMTELEEAEDLLRDREAEVVALQEEQELVTKLRIEIELRDKQLSEKENNLISLHKELDCTRCELSKQSSAFEELTSIRAQLASEQSHSRVLAHSIVTKDKTIGELQEKLRLVRFEANEKQFEAQESISRYEAQLDEMRRTSDEREKAEQEAKNMLSRYMEEKRMWDGEKDELYEALDKTAGHYNKAGLPNEERSSEQHTFSTQSLCALQEDYAQQAASLQLKTHLLDAKDAELDEIRHALRDTEDSAAQWKDALERQAKDFERCSAQLREQVDELQSRLSAQALALRSATIEAESGKLFSQDSKWRLDRHMAEIDDLKLSEARLQSQVQDLKRESAMDEIKRIELEKKMTKLEQDKEILNAALESKQVEVALLQRKDKHRNAAGTPSTTKRPSAAGNLSSSALRGPTTPTPGNNSNNTPLAKRLATSTTPSMTGYKKDIKTISNNRNPLGTSNRHNRVSDVSRTATGKNTHDLNVVEKGLAKRASLPPLVSEVETMSGALKPSEENAVRVES
ncbi:hypothetical protein L204_106386 [Cryptococcus depauperatus]|nr:hypothetical protein L204_06221 [Cryptococcus depauperatus CBS 7855]